MPDLYFVGSPKDLMEYIGREICELCLGEGVRYFYERDSSGNFSDTGMETCRCRLSESEE